MNVHCGFFTVDRTTAGTKSCRRLTPLPIRLPIRPGSCYVLVIMLKGLATQVLTSLLADYVVGFENKVLARRVLALRFPALVRHVTSYLV